MKTKQSSEYPYWENSIVFLIIPLQRHSFDIDISEMSFALIHDSIQILLNYQTSTISCENKTQICYIFFSQEMVEVR